MDAVKGVRHEPPADTVERAIVAAQALQETDPDEYRRIAGRLRAAFPDTPGTG